MQMLFRKERQAVTDAARNVKPLVVLAVVALIFSALALVIALGGN